MQDQVVIITGASRGLGRGMALALAEQGAKIAAAARSRADLPAVEQAITAAGGTVLSVLVDVRDKQQVQALVDQVIERFGRIDVLINNAGLMVGDVAFTDTTPALWSEVIDTNLTGAFFCCHAVTPHLIRQGSGVIINITSGAAVRTGFLNVPYGVSKAGLDRLTLGLAVELKPHGIACVSLSPPASATDTVRRMYPDKNVDAWAPPELTVRAVCTLLADDPMQYSGQVLSVREYLEHKGLA